MFSWLDLIVCVTKMLITEENATDDKKIDKELSKILRFVGQEKLYIRGNQSTFE